VAAVVQIALLDQVAVGQEDREAPLVGTQRDGVDRHHVGAVEEVGDAPEALRLALREQARVGGVQARQLGVLVGRAGVANLEHEALGRRRVVDHQRAVGLVAEGHALAVRHHAQQRQLVAVQAQRLGRYRGVAFDLHPAADDGLGAVEVEAQLDLANPERRCTVVFAPDQGGGAFT
jgi:hypothetical protein